MHADLNGLKSIAAINRPDLRAAQQGVTAAESQLALQKANGKMDITGTFNYTHTAGVNTGAFFYNMPLPIFNRNQGEIAAGAICDYAGATAGQRNGAAGFDRCGAGVRESADQRSDHSAVSGWISWTKQSNHATSANTRIAKAPRVLLDLSGCGTNVSREPTCLPASAGELHAGAGTNAASGGDEESAMKHLRVRDAVFLA